MREANIQACGRENDLVAFLYNELSDGEKRSFETHLRSCQACELQARDFGAIRQSVVAWRDESLGRASINAPRMVPFVSQPKTSAFAAVRAFFDLSPIWMKGAVGFAALLFCIFSVLAISNLRNSSTVAVQNSGARTYSEQELKTLVDQRVNDEIARRHEEQQPPPAQPRQDTVVKETTTTVSSPRTFKRAELVASSRSQKARRPLTKAEREELAADLRLVSSGNDRSLEDGQINQ